jgi:hypothetical protein
MFRARHTLVLAAAGWYLIVPSSRLARNDAYKQPLNRWQVVQTFDDQDSCEQFRDNFFDSSRQERSVGVLNPQYRDYMFARCVAIDAPGVQTGQPPAAGPRS